MAYVMNGGTIAPPSRQYYAGILKGYLDNGMNTGYLVDAAIRSLEPQPTESLDVDYEEGYEEMQVSME